MKYTADTTTTDATNGAPVLGTGTDTVALVSGDAPFAGVALVRTRLGRGHLGAPPHAHRRTFELFHVLDGAVDVLLGDRVVTLGAGDTVRIDPGLVHAFAACPTTTADLLIAAAPGEQRSGYFRLLDRVRRGLVDRAWLQATGERFDNAFTTSDAWAERTARHRPSPDPDQTIHPRNEEHPMSTTIRIANVNLWVFDQQQALDFYVDTLGFEVGQDVDLGFMRWLTVHPAGQPAVQLILCEPTPIASEEGIAKIKDLLADGLGGGPQLHTDDCVALHAELEAKGVTFTQGPTQMPYGTDCELVDPFGNRIRIVQPAAVPAAA